MTASMRTSRSGRFRQRCNRGLSGALLAGLVRRGFLPLLGTLVGVCLLVSADRAQAENRPCEWDTLADSLTSVKREVCLGRILQNPALLLALETKYEALLDHAAKRVAAAAESSASPSFFDEDYAISGCEESFGRVVRALLGGRRDVVTSSLVALWLREGVIVDPLGESTFYLGLDALQNGLCEESAQLLGEPITPLLQPYAQWLRVRALQKMSAERSGAMALAYLRVSPRHRFRDLLTLHAGRFLLDQGRIDDGLRLLEPWLREVGPRSGLGARGQTILAELHHLRGDTEAFREAYLSAADAGEIAGEEGDLHLRQAERVLRETDPRDSGVLVTCVTSICRQGGAAAALGAWKTHANRLSTADSLSLGRRVLDKLYAARRHRELLDLCADLSRVASLGLRQRAHVIAGRVHRRLGNLPGVIQSWRAATAWERPQELTTEASRGAAAFALWELGRELEDSGEWARADSAFSLLVSRYPAHDRARVARLRAALCRYSSGRMAEAVAELAAQCESASHRYVGSPCFWRAVLDSANNAPALLTRAAEETRPGFHALRSHRALEKGLVTPGAPGDTLFWNALAQEIQDVHATWTWPAGEDLRPVTAADRVVDLIHGCPLAEAGDILQAYGYRTWARDLWKQVPGYRALDQAEHAAFHRALGDYGQAIRLALSPGDPMAERYPLGYAPQVTRAAERFGLSPVFVLAVMRQESLLDATARSRAGAVGLMQLMPGTAERLAESLGLGHFELERPADNIILGAAHLRELMDLAGGSVPMALAAYNAGWEHAVRWLPAGGESDGFAGWDGYIERITFGETRRFVKSVLMHYWSYLRSYPPRVTPGDVRQVHKDAPGLGAG